MDEFEGFYGQPYPGTDPRQSMNGYTHDASMSGLDPSAMDTTGLGQAQTLHQIINQNNEELMRRRSNYPQQYRQGSHEHGRRASMLEFSSNSKSDLADFQFDPNPNELAMSPSNMMPVQKPLDPRKVRSREDLNLNTQFSRMNTSFDHMQGVNNFSPLVMSSTAGAGEGSTAYMPHDLDMTMDFDNMNGNAGASGMQEPMFTASPIDQSYPMSFQAASHERRQGGSMSPRVPNCMAAMGQGMSSISDSYPHQSQQHRRPTPLSTSVSITGGPSPAMASPAQMQRNTNRRSSVDIQPSYSGRGNNSKCVCKWSFLG